MSRGGEAGAGLMLVPAVLAAALLLASCARQPEVELPPTPTEARAGTPTSAPTPTPAPPDTVIVCLAQEPTSLYLYGDVNRAADAVLDVIYPGPVDLTGYTYEPVILEKVPSLEDGDAVVEPVSIAADDVYLNPETLEPDTLARGKPYAPSGCRSGDCIATYEGGSVEVDRLRVTFRLAPGTLWADGEPLRASDSVFSYEIDGHPDSPTPKYLYARTFSYRAVDELTAEWVGIPGFLDAEFPSNFWTPLPEHRLGDLEPVELLEAEASARAPLGWGPYHLSEWREGAEIRLERNPFYRTEAGTPAFESLVFRFVERGAPALEQLQTGECDLLDEAVLPAAEMPSLFSRAEAGGYAMTGAAGPAVERLDFNLQPVEGDSLFSDPRTRRGIATCVDRAAIAEGIAGELAAVPTTYLPAEHPLHDPGGNTISHDAGEARTLLTEVGWELTSGEARVRTAAGVEGLADGTPLAFDLFVLEGELTERVGAAVAEDLASCGVEARVEALPAAELFAGWPDGPVFGRRFGAVIWAWPAFTSPPCEMFADWEIPGDETPLGINASGYAGSDYAAACRSLLLSPLGGAAFEEAARRVQAEFVQDVPGVPLYQRPRAVAHASWLCGVDLDPSSATVFWNVADWAPCSPESDG